MKKMSMKEKIVTVLMFVIMLAGLIVVVSKGFNVDLKNREAKQIEIYLEQNFDMSEIQSITDEVLGKKVILQKVEVYEDMVAITASDITEDQRNSIVEKIKEKYEFDETADEVTIKTIPAVHIRELFKPYVKPFIIATLIILVYAAIRFIKIGAFKSMLETGLTAVVTQVLLFSVIAITRIPVGRYTIPMMLFVYVLSLVGINMSLEKKLKAKKIDDESKKKANKK